MSDPTGIKEERFILVYSLGSSQSFVLGKAWCGRGGSVGGSRSLWPLHIVKGQDRECSGLD